ncbi:MAG: DUF4339 domain-containing protein [Planctomycetaceae bacterium]
MATLPHLPQTFRKPPAMSSTQNYRQWICRIDGNDVGPLTIKQVRKLGAAGTLKEDSPVRKVGSTTWEPASVILSLHAVTFAHGTAKALVSTAATIIPVPSQPFPERQQTRWPPLLRRFVIVLATSTLVGAIVGAFLFPETSSILRSLLGVQFSPDAGLPPMWIRSLMLAIISVIATLTAVISVVILKVVLRILFWCDSQVPVLLNAVILSPVYLLQSVWSAFCVIRRGPQVPTKPAIEAGYGFAWLPYGIMSVILTVAAIILFYDMFHGDLAWDQLAPRIAAIRGDFKLLCMVCGFACLPLLYLLDQSRFRLRTMPAEARPVQRFSWTQCLFAVIVSLTGLVALEAARKASPFPDEQELAASQLSFETFVSESTSASSGVPPLVNELIASSTPRWTGQIEEGVSIYYSHRGGESLNRGWGDVIADFGSGGIKGHWYGSNASVTINGMSYAATPAKSSQDWGESISNPYRSNGLKSPMSLTCNISDKQPWENDELLRVVAAMDVVVPTFRDGGGFVNASRRVERSVEVRQLTMSEYSQLTRFELRRLENDRVQGQYRGKRDLAFLCRSLEFGVWPICVFGLLWAGTRAIYACRTN